MERMMTVKEASAALHVSMSLVYRLVRNGELAALRVAPHVVRIPERAVERMIESAYDKIKVD